jgi:hypothetical protein
LGWLQLENGALKLGYNELSVTGKNYSL